MDTNEDEDEMSFEGLYENGHWEWDNDEMALVFISEAVSREESILKIVCGPIQFKEDIDILEQQRYKKRYQRRTSLANSDDDVVTLQDVKNLVLYTAPLALLTPSLINVLHLPATERYLRGLILYMQYFLQISEKMDTRVLEEQNKVRTQISDMIEMKYRENLQDLRLLVTKEYCTMVIGGAEFRKFHHMGPLKKIRSVTRTDALFYEAFIRISVQIVWLALGRKAFNYIELEINRIFRSRIYNMVDHKAGTDSVASMSPQERFVLLGPCVHQDHAMYTRSPLLREIRCSTYREVDYHLLGLGVIDFPNLSCRLRYLERALVTPEIRLLDHGMTLGIIGLKRERFDTMLKEIKLPTVSGTDVGGRHGRLSRLSSSGRKSVASNIPLKLYPDVKLPHKDSDLPDMPDSFPRKSHPQSSGGGHLWCSDRQRKMWLARLAKLSAKKHHTHAKKHANA